MPNLIIAPIASFIVSAFGVSSAVAGVVAGGLVYGAALGLSYLASGLLTQRQQKPAVPRPSDGAYNLKQNVPSRPYVLGTVKKGGDYVFLEEKDGIAYHVTVWAAHRIEGFVTHYAHDKALTLDELGRVTNMFVFGGGYYVSIQTRTGLNAETAYSALVSLFPSIWNVNCRGDGLATVQMAAATAPQESLLDVYPNQMPEHSAIGNGALLYDPRKDGTQPGGSGPHRHTDPGTWEFSRNLALMRLWHLCHPVGGKMSYADMYLPEWMHAADVCDGVVTNRSGGTEPRYHGGMWFRADNDPTEVARTLDEAAEMVVYERADGKIGVHAGEFVEPDITILARHILALQVDKNRRRASTVLAVRGRYINPANAYNTEDAAIYGDPYGIADDTTERTKTFDNVAVQSHNHCQRKQKLTFARANARRVALTCDYSYAEMRDVRRRRFVRVHYPSRGLTNAVVEITSAVRIDLRNMRLSFEGIVWVGNFFAFDASVEEGVPGAQAVILTPAGVPVPTGFAVTVQTEVVSGGATAAYMLAEWDAGPASLSYELEFERTSGSTGVDQVYAGAGAVQARTPYLADGIEYRLRLRAWGGGRSSAFTSYITLTATADSVAPDPVSGASATGGSGTASYIWTAPNSPNYAAARLYINDVDTFAGSTLIATEYGAPNLVDGRTFTGLSAGTYYGFVVAINASGIAAASVATGEFEVT